MKILVVGGSRGYASWMDLIDGEVEFIEDNVSHVEKADLILFTGGEDVDPSVYGHKKNPKTSSNKSRDLREMDFYNAARSIGKAMIGVCRGAQFLTAVQPGGKLVQHVNGHAVFNPHEIVFYDGSKMLATSTHHQMMYPFDVRSYEVIAWSSPAISDIYEFGSTSDSMTRMPSDCEPEIVYYRDSRCLAIQPHPIN